MDQKSIDTAFRQRVVLSAAVLCVVGILACLLLSGCQDTASGPTPSGIVYDDAAIEGGWDSLSQEEIEANLNQQVEEGTSTSV